MRDLTHARWRKSRHSGTGDNCVEVALLPWAIGVRDSKSPDDAPLLIARPQWRRLADQIRAGAFDL